MVSSHSEHRGTSSVLTRSYAYGQLFRSRSVPPRRRIKGKTSRPAKLGTLRRTLPTLTLGRACTKRSWSGTAKHSR